MSTIVNLNKYCSENQMDTMALVRLVKNSGILVYKIGSNHFVDNEDALNKAIGIDFERKRQSAERKSTLARERAVFDRMQKAIFEGLKRVHPSLSDDDVRNLANSVSINMSDEVRAAIFDQLVGARNSVRSTAPTSTAPTSTAQTSTAQTPAEGGQP